MHKMTQLMPCLARLINKLMCISVMDSRQALRVHEAYVVAVVVDVTCCVGLCCQGSLQFFGGHTCGCVLLTADYVLTAAHCTDGRDGNP